MERAIKELANLANPDLFREVSEGVALVLESVDELDAAARTLLQGDDPGRPNAVGSFPAEVLGQLAQEEAAKALILMDAVRCPPPPAAGKDADAGLLLRPRRQGHLRGGLPLEAPWVRRGGSASRA